MGNQSLRRMEEVVAILQGAMVVPFPPVPAQARNAPHEGGNAGRVPNLAQVGQGPHPQSLHGPEDGTLALPREAG